MSDDQDGQTHEIVLIRRRSDGDEEGHHGGVWKVAFADFMTAMMAFFLVLWIVNSTTREVKTSLARYFNPIRLADSTPARKGLTDSRDQQDEATAGKDEEKAKPGETPGRDKSGAKPDEKRSPQDGAEKKDGAAPVIESPVAKSAPADDKGARVAKAVDAFQDPFERKLRAGGAQTAGGNAGAAVEAQVASLRADLEKSLGAEEMARLGGHVEVRADPEGLLISLSDGFDFGMFAIGSAEPEPRLVRILAAVAQTIGSHTGGLVLRGHTDSRPYRNGRYDNWQLSSARAQATASVLLRSGVDEKRLERIEGYSDRRPKRPDESLAPENRRIEILIRKDKR